MSKYFDENGTLKAEYMEKVQPLLDDVDRKYERECELMEARNKPLKKAFDDAQADLVKAHDNVNRTFGAWLANDDGFNLAHARSRSKKKIMADCMKTFNALQADIDEKNGTAQRKRELAASCAKLDLKPERLSLLEEIAMDEAESKSTMEE